MGKRILVPIDGSSQGWEAFEFAMGEFPAAEFVLLHVINPAQAGYTAQGAPSIFSDEWYDQAQDRAGELFAEAREMATEDIVVTTDTVVDKPARGIVEYADEQAIDQIVMGSHGRSGISRILLGSVAETVVRRSPVPVTVTR